MKETLTSLITALVFFSTTTTCFSQVHFSMNAGGSDKGVLAGLNVGYTFNSTFSIEYDQRAVLDRKNPGYFGVRVGYIPVYTELHQVSVLAGVHYRYFRDYDVNNGFKPGAGLQYLYFPPKTSVNSFIGADLYYVPGNIGIQVKVGLTL